MKELDDIARFNQQLWNKWSEDQTEYTVPWLKLEKSLLDDFVQGRIDVLPRPYMYIYPRSVLEGVAGKKILCLATGGGQQSAVFGLLDAEVTVFDLTAGQLDADQKAAEHHGYNVQTVQGDMRNLSAFDDASFDLIYQAISLVFVPDVREVYREAFRVLKPGGVYRIGHTLAATQLIDGTTVRDDGYLMNALYRGGEIEDSDSREFRHLLSDVFNGLCELGFRIEGVFEDPRHLYHLPDAKPGTDEHILNLVQKYFAIVAKKE